jgi:hypothetical protein
MGPLVRKPEPMNCLCGGSLVPLPTARAAGLPHWRCQGSCGRIMAWDGVELHYCESPESHLDRGVTQEHGGKK